MELRRPKVPFFQGKVSYDMVIYDRYLKRMVRGNTANALLDPFSFQGK
jgi:hypothetical protein